MKNPRTPMRRKCHPNDENHAEHASGNRVLAPALEHTNGSKKEKENCCARKNLHKAHP